MKKVTFILFLLWLTACQGIVVEDGDAFPTAPAATAVASTPTLANPATAVPVETSPATETAPATETTVPPTATTAPPTATPTTAAQPLRIQFEPGSSSATINGHLAAGESIEYLAWAQGGQWTHLEIVSDNNVANFSLVGVSDGQPYKRLVNEDRFWDGALPLTQDYRIGVHALTDTDFSLFLSITPLEEILQPVWPIVDGFSGFLLGGSHNGQWLDAFSVMPSLQDGERPYQLYAGSQFLGQINGRPPLAPGQGPCGGTPLVSFSPERDLSGQVGLVARWEAAPRQPQPLPLDTAVYQQAVAAFLQMQGIPEPDVQLTSINRVDLEGDGVDEVLITAARLSGLGQGLPSAAAGDYSIVLLRKVVNETVITIPIAIKLFPEAIELADPVQYNILALLDLNGDGKLEIVLEGWYYEGRFVTVYESINQDVQSVLTVGCRL